MKITAMHKFAQNKYQPKPAKISLSLGFALVELILVIIILGLLAVIILPKYTDISTDARVAKLEALEAAMRSVSNTIYSKAIIEDKTNCLANPEIEMQGQNITLRCGYPCPHPDGIENAVIAEDGYSWVGGNCGGLQGYIEVHINDAPDPSNCKIRYAASNGSRPPIFLLTDSGC